MARKIDLAITEPLGQAWKAWPVTVGLPFPQAELRDVRHVRVLSPEGREIASQMRVLSLWPDASIRWLLVDFQADVEANSQALYRVEYGRDVVRAASPTELKVEHRADGIHVDTGAVRFTVGTKRMSLLENVTLPGVRGKLVGSSERQGSVSVDEAGERYLSGLGQNYTAEVEEAGSCRVVIRCEGWHGNRKRRHFLRCIVRIYAYAGKSFVKMNHTFVDAEPANEKTLARMEMQEPPRSHHFYHYVLSRKAWDYLTELSVDLPISVGASPKLEIGGVASFTKPVNVVQYVDDSFYVHAGTGTSKADEIAHGNRIGGWVCVGDAARGVTVGVRHAWQNFPKGFVLSKNLIRVLLWPSAVPPAPIAKGVAKTHELFFYFHAGSSVAAHSAHVMAMLETGLLATARPEWYATSQAIGRILPPNRERFPRAERLMDTMMDELLAARHQHRMFGMMEFGDHGSSNAEVDLHCHGFLRYILTGERRFFDWAEVMSMHYMDVDVRHYHVNPRLDGGAIIHPRGPHHFEYGVHVCHNYLEGLLLHYLLSGYRRALDVARGMGQCMIRMMNPDGSITHDASPQGESCGRDAGRALIGLCELYRATGEKEFLDGAMKCFEHLERTQRPDGSWFAWQPSWLDEKMGYRRTDEPAQSNVFIDTGGLCGSIILRGLVKLHQVTNDPRVRNVFVKRECSTCSTRA